jgi:serine/threonine protein kinase
MSVLDSSWKTVKAQYKLTTVLGEGVSGQVVKAKHRETNKTFAIKKIPCSFKNLEQMKYVLREIAIL